MDIDVGRPKNKDVGKPLRDQRIPVQVSEEEKAMIEAAAEREGLAPSTWMRILALKAARGARKGAGR